MIQNKRVLGLIPARGGSKGVPGKNVRDFAGKPLIAWTIEAAQKSQYLDRVILSSDDSQIIDIAKEYGCDVPFVRPEALAQDESSALDVILHALETLSESYDMLVLLQPTSPLRSAEDIDSCLEACEKAKAPACVSLKRLEKGLGWMFRLNESGALQKLISEADECLRRQDSPDFFELNGAVYAAEIDWFLKNRSFTSDETMGYVMPADRSLDIDTELDFKIAEFVKGEVNV